MPTPDQWGVSSSNTDAQNALIQSNAQLIWKTLFAFPFPAPFELSDAVIFFKKYLTPDLRTLATIGQPLDTGTITVWITLQVLANYNAWSDEIEADAKKRAERRRRVAMRDAIAEAVGAVIVGIAAPAAIMGIISAVQSATQAYVQVQNAKEAAKDMDEAAQDFATSDPAFSADVTQAGNILDIIGSQGTPAPAGTPAAVTPAPGAAAPAQTSNMTLVAGGGIMAAGLTAFAIFGRGG